MADQEVIQHARSKCPICGSVLPAKAKSTPFCSPRCRMVDLSRWLGGGYAISRPLEQSDIEEGE